METSATWSIIFFSLGLLVGGIVLAMLLGSTFDSSSKLVQMVLVSSIILLLTLSWALAGTSEEFLGNFSSSVLHIQNAQILKKSVGLKSRDVYEISVSQSDIKSHSVFNNKNFQLSGDLEFAKNQLHIQTVKHQRIKEFDKAELINNPVLAMITMDDGSVSIARVMSVTSTAQNFVMEFYEAQEFHGVAFSCNSSYHFSCVTESKVVSTIEFFLSGDLNNFRNDAKAFTRSVMKISN